MNNALIIFIKNPEKGKVKTRLAKTLGDEKSLKIYNALLYHTHKVAKKINADKFVFYSSFINETDEWENNLFKKRLQKGNNLGFKMQNAVENIFIDGYKKVCIIGSDCIEITDAIINQCFIELNSVDVVIGPAKDGGYYLLCIKKLYAELFQNISWSTAHVLNETLRICEQLQLSYFLLPELIDIDVENDLSQFKSKFSFLNI